MNKSGMWENLDTSYISALRIIFAVGLFSDFAHAFTPWLRNTSRQTIHFLAGKEYGNQGNGFSGCGRYIPTGRSWLRKTRPTRRATSLSGDTLRLHGKCHLPWLGFLKIFPKSISVVISKFLRKYKKSSSPKFPEKTKRPALRQPHNPYSVSNQEKKYLPPLLLSSPYPAFLTAL